MRRITLPERPAWRAKAEEYGFSFHTIGGETYWDETVAWQFSLKEIEEDIEAPTAELEEMCLEFVRRAIAHDEVLQRLAIPTVHWPFLRESWKRGDRNLYGRFDFAYDGTGPAKLLEYNADTPTSLFEAAVFQWTWLEDQMAAGVLPGDADQFNSLHERLVEALRQLRQGRPYLLHLAHVGYSAEDKATVAYLADCARQADVETVEMAIDQIGINGEGQFTDTDDTLIQVLFKLYPWEWLFQEEFAQNLSRARTQFIEPPWKAMLSSKALLPYLWEMAPNHPNLLPAFFADDPKAASLGDHVVKPVHSREGANITIKRAGAATEFTEGNYASGPAIMQALAPLAKFDGGHAVIGSWLVASQPAGIGIREDKGAITRDTARFVPHFIKD
ncbi:MAG: glutathionylspermidine synthase family protein [Beijerinckiaceae bacterium]